jgi:hypothetical protein
MLVGHTRVPKADGSQTLELQRDARRAARRRLTQLAKSGEIKKAARGYTAE